MCDEWSSSFEAFRDWAFGNGYTDELEIDRIDPNGNYEPGNCRWVNRVHQMTNTRKRRNARTSRFKGVSRHSQNASWVAQIHSSGQTINLGSFKTQLEAAKAYDAEAVKRWGEHARINFPEFYRSRRISLVGAHT